MSTNIFHVDCHDVNYASITLLNYNLHSMFYVINVIDGFHRGKYRI